MQFATTVPAVLCWPILPVAAEDAEPTMALRGEVVDGQTGDALAARVYVRSSDGRWWFARSASPEGSAVEYRKQRFPESLEMHTTLSAHPFLVEVPPGRVTVRVERGKEYLPVEKTVLVAREPVTLKIELTRWIDMAALGWYSGDTHVHRSLEDLPNLLLAEDLNVGLPLSYWVTTAYTPPGSGQKSTPAGVRPEPIYVDATNRKNDLGGYESPIDAAVELDGSSWIAVRVFEDRADGRIRFAHSSPVHVDVPGKPLRPRRDEIDYLIRRMEEELKRNRNVLRPDALEEYREALRTFRNIASKAR